MWPVVVALLAILVVFCIRASIRPKNFPPGPPCLGWVGSLPWLDVRNLSRSCLNLSQRYGDIFSIFVGTKPVVVLNSWALISSAMKRPEFAGRPGNFSGTFFQKGKTGITTTEGKHWQKQRGFLVQHLAGLTNSKGFEEVILDEFSDLKVDLARKKTPVAVSYKLNVAILNILWNLCSGRKLHSQQQEFQTVYECIDKVTQFMSRAAIFSFMPILTKILPESVTNIERGRYYRNRFHEISEKWIREHRQDYRGNRTGDLQDAYLEKVNAGEETFTEQGLAAILRELFVIGSESESVMLRWAVRILACHPEVQERMREEAVRVVGKGTEVTWDRRAELPYTMAVMREIQRFADIVPTGLIHKTLADTELAGYNLPANTLVMCNISACHRCPDFWEKPEEFHPEHFLGAEGELLEGKEGFLPYGVGTRVCPGAELADMKMLLIIANLVLAFKLGLPEGDEGELGTQFEAGTAVLRNPKPSRTTFESI